MGTGGPLDSQTKDVGNLGKFTPTASHLPMASQSLRKPLMPKTPLQAIGYPINQAKRNIIRNKSSYKEFNMSGVNPSFKPRKGGFTHQPTGNSYLN